MAHVMREPDKLTPNEVKAMMDRGEPITVIDLRTPGEYDSSGAQITGAVHIPPDELIERLIQIPRDKGIVFYCSSDNDAACSNAATLLMENGFVDVHPLSGGFEGWITKGFPIEPK